MQLGIISLFPEMFKALNQGVIGRAIVKEYVSLLYWNPRDFVSPENPNRYQHRVVDDRPYGGGPGMVMRIQPLQDALKSAKAVLGQETQVIHLSPQGKLLTQESVNYLARKEKLILIASRYEGVDERFLEMVDEEWSIGDYVVTGGELPAMVLIDAIVRLIPNVLGHEDSVKQDSFMNGLLDCPHYTRPEKFEEKCVPRVLLEGNHQAIANWRLQQALGRTWLRRPDLFKKKVLTPLEEQLLNNFICECNETKGTENE